MEDEAKREEMKVKALGVCRDFLDGPWQKVSLEELSISDVKGGLSNKLYLVALPDSLSADCGSKTPREVLLRIYGSVQSTPEIVVREAVTFMLLSERGLGPKLYGLFPGGRLEQYIPSHFLCADEMRLYVTDIARQMAKIHALDVPVKKKPGTILKFTAKWLGEAKKALLQGADSFSMPYEDFEKEFEWVKNEIARSNSPVVYCHNDLQGGNILYREDSARGQLVLIDFEFGSYNYRDYDFASHFCERCVDYSFPEHPYFKMDVDKFPSRQEQVEFFTAYFDQLTADCVQLKISFEEELATVLKEMPLFACACHLVASLWAVSMSLPDSPEFRSFGHREYAEVRLAAYKKFKEQYLTASD